jgi:hypothetical protein
VSDSITVASPPAPAPAPVVTPSPKPTPPVVHADRTAPRIHVANPQARVYKVGRTLRIKLSFTDASGRVHWTATLRRSGGKARTVKQGAKVRLSRTGRYELRVRAKDRFGNRATKTVHFRVTRS